MNRCPPGEYGISIVPTNRSARELNKDEYHRIFRYNLEKENIVNWGDKSNVSVEKEIKSTHIANISPTDIAIDYLESVPNVIPISVDVTRNNVIFEPEERIGSLPIHQLIGKCVTEKRIKKNKKDRDYTLNTGWIDNFDYTNHSDLGTKILSKGTPDVMLVYTNGGSDNLDETNLSEYEIAFAEVKAEFVSKGRDSEQQSQLEWAWLFNEIPRYEIKLDLLSLVDKEDIEDLFDSDIDKLDWDVLDIWLHENTRLD